MKHFYGPDGEHVVALGPRDFFVVILAKYVTGERTAQDVQQAYSEGFLTWQQVVEILGVEQAYSTASGQRQVA